MTPKITTRAEQSPAPRFYCCAIYDLGALYARSEVAAGSSVRIKCASRGECCSPSNPGTPQNCLRRFCGEPHSGFPPPLGKRAVLYHGSIVYPLPAGFPRNRSPLKGNPPFRGTPSALGHEGVRRGPTVLGGTFGTRAQGRPRTAPPRRRHVMPLAMRPLREENGALPAHFTSALGTHTVAAALKRALPCERLVSGSTPNEITSCQATSRSGFF